MAPPLTLLYKFLILPPAFAWALQGIPASAVEVELPVYSKTVPSTCRFTLPFPYKAIEPGKSFAFVYQFGVGLLAPGSPEEYLVVGPCQPCEAIVLRNPGNNRIIAFHKQYQSDMKSISKFVSFLEAKDSRDLVVTLFTVRHFRFDEQFRSKHGGRSQAEDLAYTKELLIKDLGLDPEKVQPPILFSDADPWADRDRDIYLDSDKFLLIAKDGSIHCTGPYAEDVMRVRSIARDFYKNLAPHEFSEFSDRSQVAYARPPCQLAPSTVPGAVTDLSALHARTQFFIWKRCLDLLRKANNLSPGAPLPWAEPDSRVPFFLVNEWTAPPGVTVTGTGTGTGTATATAKTESKEARALKD